MFVRYVIDEDWDDWRSMRVALWPHATTPDDEEEMRSYIEDETSNTSAVLVARRRMGNSSVFWKPIFDTMLKAV